MDIKTFLDLCAGSWFSQRTNYGSDGAKAESSKADLNIALVAADDAKVNQICLDARIDPKSSTGGLMYSWDTSVDWGKPKRQGSSLMVLVPQEDDTTKGKLVTNTQLKPGVKSVGTYVLGEDEALTLFVGNEEIQVEERIWFASDNLRLRAATTKQGDRITQTTFYSEIRKAPPKETQQS